MNIPAGVDTGSRIKLSGEGEHGPNGGPAGDLLITVRVTPHACFQRQGANLVVKVPITVAEASLGAKVDVPTPNGVVTLTVPPNSSSGKRLRLKGLGIVKKGGDVGDLFAEMVIRLPESLDTTSQDLIREFDHLNPQDPRDGLAW